MTNDECRMNDEDSPRGFWHSSFLRHWTFVIRHLIEV